MRLPEASASVAVYVRVPESSSLDQRSELVRVSSELCLDPRRGAPLGQLPETVGGDVALAPEGEVGHVGPADHVAEVGQPGGEREVLGVGHVRPDSLHGQLERGR